MQKCNCPGQILTRGLCPGSVYQCKCIVTFSGQFQCLRKTVVHSRNIHKSTSGIYDSGLCPCISTKEEKTSIRLIGICRFFLIAIYVIEYLLSGYRLSLHVVDYLNCLIRIYLTVPEQDILHIFKFEIIIYIHIHRKYKPPIISKHRISHHIHYLAMKIIWRKLWGIFICIFSFI